MEDKRGNRRIIISERDRLRQGHDHNDGNQSKQNMSRIRVGIERMDKLFDLLSIGPKEEKQSSSGLIYSFILYLFLIAFLVLKMRSRI